jgi:hypothetical protein
VLAIPGNSRVPGGDVVTTSLPNDRIVDRLPAADGAEIVIFWFDGSGGTRHGYRCSCSAQSAGWQGDVTESAGRHRDVWHGGPAEVVAS